MTIRSLAFLAGLTWTAPLAAQQAEGAPRPAAAEPAGMERVLALRAAGIGQWGAGRFTEAAATFEAALQTLDSLPRPRPDHATVGFFPHYLLFMPPLNY